ncbi:Mediator of RNA polymerase II transcription subunit 25 [Trichoplax sp. H2]|nr:Mediator of RNA polymerase II transcription subunit 25 [Trichoplax sp. H2]|eukprot:RDD38903.1 Mediator of RNA polymerase II transcription subunit 25 [Trichoplax sp. H2]
MADVVFVVEATANLAEHFTQLKESYLLPAMEAVSFLLIIPSNSSTLSNIFHPTLFIAIMPMLNGILSPDIFLIFPPSFHSPIQYGLIAFSTLHNSPESTILSWKPPTNNLNVCKQWLDSLSQISQRNGENEATQAQSPIQYGLIAFSTLHNSPESTILSWKPPTNNLNVCKQWLDSLRFNGGGVEEYSAIEDGLGVALQCFDDMQAKYHKENGTIRDKFCILVCNSSPCGIPSSACYQYCGYSCERIAELIGSRKVNLSVISPRRISTLCKLYDKSIIEDLHVMPSQDYATSPHHLVLLKGFKLATKERSEPKTTVEPKPQPVVTNGTKEHRTVNDATANTRNFIPPSTSINSPPKNTPVVVTAASETIMPPVRSSVTNAVPMVAPVSLVTPPQTAFNPTPRDIPPVKVANRDKPNSNEAIPEIRKDNISRSYPHTNPSTTKASLEITNRFPNTNPTVPPNVRHPQPNLNVQRHLIWSGLLSWERHNNKVDRRSGETLSVNGYAYSNENIRGEDWPRQLILRFVPGNLLAEMMPLLRKSIQILFHISMTDNNTKNLIQTLTQNKVVAFISFQGISLNPEEKLRLLILTYNPKKNFTGYIPRDQMDFVQKFQVVMKKSRETQKQKQQMQSGGYPPHSVGQPQMYVNQQQQQPQPQPQQSLLQSHSMKTPVGAQQLSSLSTSQSGPITSTKNSMVNMTRSSNFELGANSLGKLQHLTSLDSQSKDLVKNYESRSQVSSIESILQQQPDVLSRFQHLNQQRQGNTMQQQQQSQVRNFLNQQQQSNVTQPPQQQLLNQQQQQQQQRQSMSHQHNWALQQRLQRMQSAQNQSQQLANTLNSAQNRAPSEDWYP